MDENTAEIQQSSQETQNFTPEETALIDKALLDYKNPETLVEARKKIASFGNKVLPYIKDKLDENEYSIFVECLAEVKDLEMVLEYLKKILNYPKPSTCLNIIWTTRRLIYQVRKNNSDDPILDSVCKTLIEYRKEVKLYKIMETALGHQIALTGTERAKNFLEENNLFTNDSCEGLFTNMNYFGIDISEPNPSHKEMLGLNNPNPFSDEDDIIIDDENEETLETPLPEPPKELKHIFRVGKETMETRTAPARTVESSPEADYPETFVQFFENMEKLHDLNPESKELINAMEKELGIETKMQRDMEASLLIDWQLFCTGIIADCPNPERMFGEKEWADWITARLAARAYGNGPLNLDFITFIHSCLTRNATPSISGGIRNFGMVATEYKSRSSITYTDGQLEAVKENPLLTFSKKGSEPNTGVINYPEMDNKMAVNSLSPKAREYYDQEPSTPRLLECLLVDLCDWYNQQLKTEHDPHALAAELQRRFVAIHPFEDVNGRTSRLLMNWSLENDGVSPAILFNPEDDIVTPKENWANEVRQGSDLYSATAEKRKQLEAIGYESTPELMGLSELKTFYDWVFSKIMAAPSSETGEVLDHRAYADFIIQFQKEYDLFLSEYRNTREESSSFDDTIRIFPQGGLIPQSYVDLISISPKDFIAYQKYLLAHFYGDGLVYRGNMSYEQISTEEDVLKLFENYIGAGSSYLAVKDARLSPVTSRVVQPQFIAKSLQTYNDYVANSYLANHYPEIPRKIISRGANLEEIVSAHIETDEKFLYLESPFVSTSLLIDLAEHWSANKLIKNAKSGILFTLKAPAFGGIFTFKPETGYFAQRESDLPGLKKVKFTHPFESEMLVPGAICPMAVTEITINSPQRKPNRDYVDFSTLSYKAKKIEGDNGIFVEIQNLIDDKTSRYQLDSSTGHYIKVS